MYATYPTPKLFLELLFGFRGKRGTFLIERRRLPFLPSFGEPLFSFSVSSNENNDFAFALMLASRRSKEAPSLFSGAARTTPRASARS